MKRKIQYFSIALFFLFSLKATGQVTPKETVVNEIYRSFIDSGFVYYYLSVDCPILNTDKDNWNKVKQQFKDLIPDLSLIQIMASSIIDSLPLKWNIPALAHVRDVDTTNANNILGKPFSNPQQKLSKKMEEERKIWSAKSKFERTVYYFSRPVFDNKQQYALIRMKREQASISQFGYAIDSRNCIFLLKDVNGHWKIIDKSCVAL